MSEQIDNATAKLLLALAFVLERGTDVQKAFGDELMEYRDVWRAEGQREGQEAARYRANELVERLLDLERSDALDRGEIPDISDVPEEVRWHLMTAAASKRISLYWLFAVYRMGREDALTAHAGETRPTCATCQHWDGHDNPLDHEGRAMCAVDTIDYLTLGVFRTKPTFGCTLWALASPVASETVKE